MRLDQLTPVDLTALLEQSLSSLEEVCVANDAGDWDRPTDCPGWSVKDQLSHVASYEAMAIGRPASPEVDLSHCTWIKLDDTFAVANERELEARRPLPGPAVLAEFQEVVPVRLKELRGLDEAGWEAHTSTLPFGPVKTKDGLRIRILDVFFHEQDIRRAVGRPGHLGGDVARMVFEVLALGLARQVVKGAGAPEGSAVTWKVGEPGRTLSVVVKDGRGVFEPSGAPTAVIDSDLETFLCLMGGRWSAERALSDGKVTLAGDTALAQRVLETCVVVP